PGLTAAECPSGQAAELRRTIDALVASGATNREIDAWAVANYGEAALGRPRGLLAWLAPAAAVLVGLGLVLAKLGGAPGARLRAGARPSSPAGPVAPISPDQQERLLQELRSFARKVGR
ncbi:MAG: cytochrome c-type biogenesis protein CcmH, partial [Actinomycetota bacterium]